MADLDTMISDLQANITTAQADPKVATLIAQRQDLQKQLQDLNTQIAAAMPSIDDQREALQRLQQIKVRSMQRTTQRAMGRAQGPF